MKKQALVIAGGKWQIPLIQYLQKNGYVVTVVDPYKDSPGVKIANNHIQEDVKNKEVIFDIIKDMSFEFIITDQSDISVKTVAYLNEKMNLRGNPVKVVEKFSNKNISREFAQKIGVPIPEFTTVNSVGQINDFVKKAGLPLIIKPVDFQGSSGVFKIENDTCVSDKLELYLKEALKYSTSENCILEQFMEGYEITVDGFCANGKHRTLAISRKKHFKTGVASSITYPANIPTELEQQIIAMNDKYVESTGLQFAPTHAEYIVNEKNGTFGLIEIACRGGGNRIVSDAVKWVSGFDIYKALLKCLEGKPVDVKEIVPLRRSAALHFFDFGDGIIEKIEGFEDIKDIPGLIFWEFNYREGDKISTCKDDRSRQGFMIVVAEDTATLQKRTQKILNLFKVKLKNE